MVVGVLRRRVRVGAVTHHLSLVNAGCFHHCMLVIARCFHHNGLRLSGLPPVSAAPVITTDVKWNYLRIISECPLEKQRRRCWSPGAASAAHSSRIHHHGVLRACVGAAGALARLAPHGPLLRGHEPRPPLSIVSRPALCPSEPLRRLHRSVLNPKPPCAWGCGCSGCIECGAGGSRPVIRHFFGELDIDSDEQTGVINLGKSGKRILQNGARLKEETALFGRHCAQS